MTVSLEQILKMDDFSSFHEKSLSFDYPEYRDFEQHLI